MDVVFHIEKHILAICQITMHMIYVYIYTHIHIHIHIADNPMYAYIAYINRRHRFSNYSGPINLNVANSGGHSNRQLPTRLPTNLPTRSSPTISSTPSGALHPCPTPFRPPTLAHNAGKTTARLKVMYGQNLNREWLATTTGHLGTK